MSNKALALLGLIAVVFIGYLVFGGSSDDSSGWSSEEAAQIEDKIMSEVTTADGQYPTQEQAACIVDHLKSMDGVSASDVLENKEASPEQEEEISQFTTDCIGTSVDSEESSGLSTEVPESVIGGPACEEDLSSSACAEEEQEKIEAAQQEEMEIYEESQESAEAPLP